jgi:NADH-quinone oxidoreductase chain G
MVTITINDREIRLEKPVTILEAAQMNGIEIPHLCHHPFLEKWGGCRMCLVEVGKLSRLEASCMLEATDGMVVRTESPEISKARKAVLEFLLINHALECPVCEKAGQCKLQDYTLKYGPTAGRFEEGKRQHQENLDDPIIVRNMGRCIMCTRCVRMCREVQGASAIAVTGRGNESLIEPFTGRRYNCEYCGNCLTVCPTGALTSRLQRYRCMSWQISKEVKTICGYCGVGCSMMLQIRDNSIMSTMPKVGLGVNNGILCNRGRFGYDYVGSSKRLSIPLIRKNGRLEPATWDEALSMVSQRLRDIKEKDGGDAIAGIASGRCTNEDNYLFQKLMRAGLQTNNIDSTARMGYAGAQRFLEAMLGQGVTANLISEIVHSDTVLTVGGDPSHINPVLGIQVRLAFGKGSKVVTVGHAAGLKRHRSTALEPFPETEGAILAGLLSGIMNKRQMPDEDKELESAIGRLDRPSLLKTVAVSGVKIDVLAKAVSELSRSSNASIIVGCDVVRRKDGGSNLLLIAALAYILKARIYLMSERPNEQGLIDTGCLPDMLPGERPLALDHFRKRLEGVWGARIPENEGLTLMEFIEAASTGTIKALYVMGENPAYNLPDSAFVKEALEKLDFLVVQDIFMSETGELADVVLPALSWAEKEGTYVNLERTIQKLGKGVSGTAMEDWRIISEVGKRVGLEMPYDSASDVMTEMATASPLYSGLTYEEIEQGADQWPYKGKPLRHTLIKDLLNEKFYSKPAIPDRKTVSLAVEKPLFHSGTLSSNSTALMSIMSEPAVRVCKKTAEEFSLDDGEMAEISSSKGSLTLRVKIDEVPESILCITNNFRGKGAMGLFGYSIEPLTKVPVLESPHIRIQKSVDVTNEIEVSSTRTPDSAKC